MSLHSSPNQFTRSKHPVPYVSQTGDQKNEVRRRRSLTLLLVVFPAVFLASATDFVVGDHSGWTVDVDYQAWASGKKFFVGDTLRRHQAGCPFYINSSHVSLHKANKSNHAFGAKVFNYDKSKHNVYTVDKAGFGNCTVPSNGVLNTGNDRIALSSPGKKWYICGVGEHCAKLGMKLIITVEPLEGPAAAPDVPPGGSPPLELLRLWLSEKGLVFSAFSALFLDLPSCRHLAGSSLYINSDHAPLHKAIIRAISERLERRVITKPYLSLLYPTELASMASMKMFIVLLVAVVVAGCPVSSVAKEFVVGDDHAGWNINFNQSWAEGKDFRSKHNVYKVDKAGFGNCTVPSNGVLNTGNDRITLSSPGKKWYICGVGEHCAKLGMKLVITVQPLEEPAPAPGAPPATPGSSNSANGRVATFGLATVMVVVALGFLMIMA
ncbi:hypothetical protein H6P81_015592 [Aristolochia fimbriata]|uniref:Phytocyanin domain-containing protein n=1 Tax=Aristolochia fimbriata TaxID=158543 RepID=A0AAV7E9R6_ARIFI|nr:hypothetical protein H6P81_015592 [Aristolochia fimbriata]